MEMDDILVGSIDQGTQSTRFLVFDRSFEVVALHQIEHAQIQKNPGWCEHDPTVILENAKECIREVVNKLGPERSARIRSIGITNQRETTVVWDRETGKPLYNAIVWHDMRTEEEVKRLNLSIGEEFYRELTGLPFSTYFSALKLSWLRENVPEVAKALKEKTCCVGTIDSWLIWSLSKEHAHATDVTNASRTMLMNIKTLEWEPKLLAFFRVPLSCLPKIRSCSEFYGTVDHTGTVLDGVAQITGVAGDQQAAALGHGCLSKGDAKSTYGTGNFTLINTGPDTIIDRRLLTTVCYQLGPKEDVVYALEGAIAVAGSAVSWLRDSLGLIGSVSETSELSTSVPDTGGVMFVPAFSGLFAPYWRTDARGAFLGLTLATKKAHMVRALLEGVAHEVCDVIGCAKELLGSNAIPFLLSDGGMTKNTFLMQKQAELLGIRVHVPAMAEATALGAALAAGLSSGVWTLGDVESLREKERASIREYAPDGMDESTRRVQRKKWKSAIERSMGWSK
eukprot:TRINITY_DN2209_c0_g1_i1.p1 TRINITY_DN2209_c0_g1~~TRINITY_DN2209_c0_g1_i1.p1  ORF type:complete len:532 (+),score=148.30 TRINITY_DN2209_c0_g1_i1:72-1598(+)